MKNAPVYRSAEALGIEQWEYDGLVALVGPLSRGELRLDMREPMCGTVGCIGGHLAWRANKDANSYVDGFGPLTTEDRSLSALFYPAGQFANSRNRHAAWNATAPQAARAIVNFLTLGDPRWDDVMREPADEIGAA